MNDHTIYAGWLRRRIEDDPTLTKEEQRALDAHMMDCLRCNFDFIFLMAGDALNRKIDVLRAKLTVEIVTPYLADLARAERSGLPLSAFHTFLKQFIDEDERAMGRYRLAQAMSDWDC